VLLGAATLDLRMWESTLEWLTGIARVTTYDYRDSGLSSPGTAPFSEIDDIAALLDAAGIESAVLVGCSEGARRALAFAHAYPHRVVRVAAVAGAFGEFPDPTPEEAEAWKDMEAKFEPIDRALEEHGVRVMAEVDLDTWAPLLNPSQRRQLIGLEAQNVHRITLEHYLGYELDPPVKHRFAEITTPISVLVGDHDFRGTVLWGQRIADQAPDATLTVLSGADHFPMLTAPDEFERFVREVLTAR
jgi:3-oxoadipate enol-lactonase